jgi:hypothetical protein
MDTRVQTIPLSFQDDTIAPRPLSYVPSRQAKSDSPVDRVCNSTQVVANEDFESKIDHALINDHCKEVVWLDGVPYRRAAGTFIGTARRRQSTFGGNNATKNWHPEQLLYDGATTR